MSFRTTISSLIATLIMIACSPSSSSTDSETPNVGSSGWITIEPTRLLFESGGGTLTAVINSSEEWEHESDGIQYWYNLEPTSGLSGDTITIILAANNTRTPISKSLRFNSRDSYADLLVVQYAASESAPDDNVEQEEEEENEEESTPTIPEEESDSDPEEDSEPDTEEDSDETTPESDLSPEQEESEDMTPPTDQPTEDEDDTEEETEPTPDQVEGLTISNSQFNFSSQGEIKELEISGSGEWMISLSSRIDWLTLSQTEGSDVAKVTIEAEENPLTTSRSTVIVFVAAGDYSDITITQSGR